MTTDKKFTPRHWIVVAGIAFASILLLLFGAGLSKEGYVDADKLLWVICIAVFLGLFSIMASVELATGGMLAPFQTAKGAWALLIALAAFAARRAAIDDVNAVFHLDASALPMTVWADALMCAFTWMKWPFWLLLTCSAALIAWGGWKGMFDGGDGDISPVAAILAFSNVFVSLLGLGFIHTHLSEAGRPQRLYRIAHATDFSSTFRCLGIDERTHSVLFIGPEQRRVLIAPKLPEQLPGPHPAVFEQVKIPAEFPVVDCVPTLNFQEGRGL